MELVRFVKHRQDGGTWMGWCVSEMDRWCPRLCLGESEALALFFAHISGLYGSPVEYCHNVCVVLYCFLFLLDNLTHCHIMI